MTIEIIVRCDGYKCAHQREINEDADHAIESLGWGIDYHNGYHYCPSCWKEIDSQQQVSLDSALLHK